MTPDRFTANLTRGLIPALSTADVLDVLADCLNELDRRGGDVTLDGKVVTTQWAEVDKRDGAYGAVFWTEGSAEDASGSVSRTAQLDKAKILADQLLVKERNRAGSGKNGEITDADLVPLLQVLDA